MRGRFAAGGGDVATTGIAIELFLDPSVENLPPSQRGEDSLRRDDVDI